MGQIKNIKLHIVTDIKTETQTTGLKMTQDINELRNDLHELESVLGMVNRSNVRMIIADAISTLKTKVEDVERKAKAAATKPAEQKPPMRQTLYTAKISNYGWDEGKKFVKVYVTLPNLDKLTEEQISCDFTTTSGRIMCSKSPVLQEASCRPHRRVV